MRYDRHFMFLNAGHCLDHLLMLLFPTAVLVMGVEFGADYSELLTLAVWGFIAFGAGALPAGWLGDRWSRTGMLVVFFIGCGLATILTGLARTPLELALGLALIGLFASIYHPVGIALVAEHSTQLGRALGINGVFGNLGVALAGITAGGLASLWGWRAAFIVPGLITVLIGFAYLAFIHRSPDIGGIASKPKVNPQTKASRVDQRRVFLVLIVVTLLGGVIFHAMTVGLPKLLTERMETLAPTTAAVGFYVTLVFGIAALAQIVVGHLIDRYPIRTVLMGLVALQIPFFLLAAGTGEGLLLLAALGLMLLVFGEIPIHDAIVARYAAASWRSRIYAVKYLLALGVSATAIPLVATTQASAGGFTLLLWILAAMAALILVAAFLLPRPAAESVVDSIPSAAVNR